MAGQRLDRRHQGLAAAWLWVVAAACAGPPPPPPDAIPLDVITAAHRLAGTWEWIHYEVDGHTTVRERERWQLAPDADRRHLVGTFHRDVLVRAIDGKPFECNQRLRYHQRADVVVTAVVTAAGIAITERSYTTVPSPCDPGLRQLGGYLGQLDGDRLHLAWDGGDATLTRAETAPRPQPPPTAAAPAGRWTWQATSWTKSGLLRDEDEDWELAIAPDGSLGGTYVRVVTVRSPDNTSLPCAGAPGYVFVDRYLVRGQRVDDGWRLDETDVLPGAHPCLAATPDRTLDGATATADGDYLVLSWRGKRRQVLGRTFAD